MQRTDTIERFFDSGLKLQHLRILVTLADLKQIKAVAQAFNVSQPAISKRIAELEAALGIELITRAGQGVDFTPCGNLILDRGREILHQLDHARKGSDTLPAGDATSRPLRVAPTVTP